MPTSSTTLGPDVLLIRRTFDGDIIEAWIPALLAASMLMDDEENGVVYEAAWVVEDPDNNLSGWLMSSCLLPIEEEDCE
jgi:hypothetical protein